MMQSMRNLAHTKAVKTLMILLIVSFALWGIGDIFRGNPLERSVAKVGSDSISVQALNREFDQTLPRARQIFGSELTAAQAKKMGVLDKTLQTMIQRSLIDQAIDKLGINVSQKTIVDDIAMQPEFRDKDGKFNAALFRQLLQQARMDERTFFDQGRRDLERRQIINALTPPEKVPQSEIEGIYKARGQKRFVDILMLKNDSMTDIPKPDDKALQDYYQEHIAAFTAPEYRSITIARLSLDSAAKDISVSEEDVKKQYDRERDQLRIPERRDLLQVVMQDEVKAKELSAKLKNGGEFRKEAKAMGYDTVAINDTEESGLPPELAKPVFEMGENQVSSPIQSSLGWHVVQVKKIMPTKVPSYEEVKDQLREELKKDQAIENVTRMVNQWDDELAAGHSLEDIADEMKLRLIKIPSIDATGKLSDGKAPSELPEKENMLKTAFAQGSGDISPIMDDKSGNYSVVRIDSITPSAPRPLDQVKEGVVSAWKAEQQAKAAKVEADKIAQGLRDGKDPASFVKAGVTIRTSDGISMLGDNDSEMPPSLLPQIYKLKMKEVATASVGDKQYILRLIKLAEADPLVGANARFKITDEIRKNATSELTEQYLDYLGQVFPVKINQDLIDTLRQQGS